MTMTKNNTERTRETIELAVKSCWPFDGSKVRIELMECCGAMPGKGDRHGTWPTASVYVSFTASNAISIETLEHLRDVVKRLTDYEFGFLSVEKQNPKKTGYANICMNFNNYEEARES